MESIFNGNVINTPSIMCMLDVNNTLDWVKTFNPYKKTLENYNTINQFFNESEIFTNLCTNTQHQSKTSVCFTCKTPWFKSLQKADQDLFVNKISKFLQDEKVALDIKGYKSAPPSFRVWCGITVEKEDIKILCEWFNYAYNKIQTTF